MGYDCISSLSLLIFLLFGIGMISLANISVSIRVIHFLTCCGSFSSLF